MDVRLRELAAKQDDVVAGWQLKGAGWTRAMVEHHAHRNEWSVVHPGVYALGHAPLTRRRIWFAATLSAPHTFLAAASAGALFGFRDWEGAFETVVRPGSGGPRRMGSLLVGRSTTLEGHTTIHDGIATVTAARALIDLAPWLGSAQLGRAFRESCRLGLHTPNELAKVVRMHRGRRGIALLGDLCDRYATIPYHRCRSDPECRALEVLHDAGFPPPKVNIEVAGREADLTWHGNKLIVEIDGPQWHLFKEQDAQKEARWRSAGYTVRRLPSDDVYDRPERLLAASRR